jgi:site-specific recombinase XerD
VTPRRQTPSPAYTLARAAQEWLTRGRTQKLSAATETARRQDLVAIATRLAERLDRPAAADAPPAHRLDAELGRLVPGDLAGPELLDAVADYAAGHAPASVRRVLSTWRGFGRHLVAADCVLSNPVDGLMGPKRPEWMPKALEYAELERIAQAAGSTDPRARDPWPERDSALFAVFAGAGVRSGEAIAMRVGSVEAAERSPRLRVLGKGNKPRVIPVGPEVVAEVGRYLESRVERAGRHSPTDPLFVRRLKGQYVPFNLQAMDGLVAGWYRRAGVIPPPGSLPHALRHTYATLLVDAGASLPEVQRLLGHADLSTTQVYLKVAGRGLEEAALSNPARALIRGKAEQ